MLLKKCLENVHRIWCPGRHPKDTIERLEECTVCCRPFRRCRKNSDYTAYSGPSSRPVTRQPGGSIYTATLHRASEMKLQTSANGARRGVLEGYLFALFGDLVGAVGDVGHIEFQVEPPRLGLPQIYSGS